VRQIGALKKVLSAIMALWRTHLPAVGGHSFPAVEDTPSLHPVYAPGMSPLARYVLKGESYGAQGANGEVLVDPVFLDLAVEGAPADAEELRRQGHVPRGLDEGGPDGVPFYLAEGP